ncbi:MAG TPA: hypothetical protein VK582_04650 [Pyrinomonadaceae bacterium]|nr:hypothetical protein [Pyrinomonadaceae bacterium]
MIYDPELWRDFFVMVGGGAAALSGLVFVAMSLNLESVVGDATHRNRAIGTLAGFTYSFILCGFALMGHPGNVALGIEWLVLSGIAGFVYVRGYIRASSGGGSRNALSLARTVFGTACYLAQIAGSVLLIDGYGIGIYLAGGGMMLFFASLISGAWLLLVGICNDKKSKKV